MSRSYPIVEHRLSNGLRIVACRDTSAPSVALAVTYGTGSRDDPRGRTGMAHLFEHLMFEGSRNVASGEHMRSMQVAGGVCNAGTSADVTVAYQQVPPGALELALWLEADRMATLPEALTQPSLDKQRRIAMQERHQRLGQPGGSVPEHARAALFSGHPYEHLALGKPADLGEISLADLRAHYDRWFRPDNAVLTAVGDVDSDELRDLAATYFTSIPGTPRTNGGVPRDHACDPGSQGSGQEGGRDGDRVVRGPLPAPIQIAVPEPNLPFPLLGLAFRGPANSSSDTDIFGFYVALKILAGGDNSRVYARLVRAEGIAQQVDADLEPMALGSAGMITALAMPDAPATALEDALCGELENLADKGPTLTEVRQARAITGREILRSTASLLARATGFGHFAATLADAGALLTQADRLAQVEAEDVQHAAATWLLPTHRAAITCAPASAPTS